MPSTSACGTSAADESVIAFLDSSALIYLMEGAPAGLKTPDALHAACGLQLGDDHVFLTGDAAFRRVAGLHCQLITGTGSGAPA